MLLLLCLAFCWNTIHNVYCLFSGRCSWVQFEIYTILQFVVLNAITIVWIGSFCDCLEIWESNKNTTFGDPVFLLRRMYNIFYRNRKTLLPGFGCQLWMPLSLFCSWKCSAMMVHIFLFILWNWVLHNFAFGHSARMKKKNWLEKMKAMKDMEAT